MKSNWKDVFKVANRDTFKVEAVKSTQLPQSLVDLITKEFTDWELISFYSDTEFDNAVIVGNHKSLGHMVVKYENLKGIDAWVQVNWTLVGEDQLKQLVKMGIINFNEPPSWFYHEI